MTILVLHFPRFLYYILQFFLLEAFIVLDPLLSKLLQARRRDKHYIRLQVRVSQDFQTLRMKIKDTDFARVHDGSNCLNGGAVIRFLVFTVFDELSTQNVGLELRTRDEMVVLSVHFGILPRTTGVWKGERNTRESYPKAHCTSIDECLRGIAAAKRSLSCISLCLNSCRPIFGGPIRTIGLLWFALG